MRHSKTNGLCILFQAIEFEYIYYGTEFENSVERRGIDGYQNIWKRVESRTEVD